MSASALGASEQQNHHASADALSVFAALANQDRLTTCLAAAGCLAAARQVCRRVRDLVDGGVKSIRLKVTADKAEDLTRRQALAALLRRWDRCQGITVELCGDWDNHACAVQAMPLWLFSGVSSDALARIRTFAVSTSSLKYEQPSFIPLVSALAALMPSLRHLDLSGCHGGDDEGGWPRHDGIGAHLYSLFYADLAASCPRLETLVLPWDAYLAGVEALAGSLVRLRVAGDHSRDWESIRFLSNEALWSVHQLKHLRELTLEALVLDEEDWKDTETGLLRLLDGMPPSLEQLELPDVLFSVGVRVIRFDYRGGRLHSVDVKDGFCFGEGLRVFLHALLQCRALGTSVGAGGSVGPQYQRPSLRIREVIIGRAVEEEPISVTELAPLLERFSLAPLDAITFEDLSSENPGAVAQRVGDIVSVFGLPRELRDTSNSRLSPLPLGLVGAPASAAASGVATTTATAHTVEMAFGPPGAGMVGTNASVGVAPGSVASAAAAAPSAHGGGSSQTGASTGPLALETAGFGDVLRVVVEWLWADTDTSGAAGGPDQGAAGGWELGLGVLLHGPCRGPEEWSNFTADVDAKLQLKLPYTPGVRSTGPSGLRVIIKAPTVQWHLAGPQFVVAMCPSSGKAETLMAIASSPDGPFARDGIQATRLRAGAVRSALESVLLELWRGSATSNSMSQEQRLGRLVELRVGASRVAERDRR